MKNHTRLLPAGLQLSADQIDVLDSFGHELRRMNQRINLVSGETESEFWKRHTAHCLALATRSFRPGSRVVDWGTGGGLPAIPLAVVFPEVEFIGVDSVRKKVQSCTAIARRLDLDNCAFVHARAEDISVHADYSVSRATAPLATLWTWHTRIANVDDDTGEMPTHSASINDSNVWQRGLICLKGGDLSAEIQELQSTAPEVESRPADVNRGRGDIAMPNMPAPNIAVPNIKTYPLSELFDDPWFEEKMIVQVHPE